MTGWWTGKLDLEQPQVTVVIPLYNKAASVAAAINSVLAQTYRDFELLIIDDGSTDQSLQVAASFNEQRIRIIEQTNQGVSAARNSGIEHARAELIAFLDADDCWAPQFLTHVVALSRRFPDAGAYATGYLIKNPDQTARPADFRFVPEAPDGGILESWFKAIAHGHNPMWSSAVAIPKRTFKQVGGFPVGVRLYEDLHLWTRIALQCSIAFIDQPLATYCRDAENRACNSLVPTAADMAFAELVEQACAANRLSDADAGFARRVVAHYALMNAFKTAVAGHGREARLIASGAPRAGVDHQLRRWFVYLMSGLPAVVVQTVWRAGRWFKQRTN